MEAVGAEFTKQIEEGRCISVQRLRKTFGSKVAVADLDLEMFEGQITVLLGHNGTSSRRRDCHSTAPPSTFSRCFNSDGEAVSAK